MPTSDRTAPENSELLFSWKEEELRLPRKDRGQEKATVVLEKLPSGSAYSTRFDLSEDLTQVGAVFSM